MQVNRRLYRCRENRRLAGVAAGVAEYFDLDPTLVRVLWFLSTFFYGLGLLVYIVMAVVVPLEPAQADATAVTSGDAATAIGGWAAVEASGHRHAARGESRWTTYVGVALILFGTLALVHMLLPDWELQRYLVPAVVIGLGAFLVASSIRRAPMRS
jgi:phage shock protein C